MKIWKYKGYKIWWKGKKYRYPYGTSIGAYKTLKQAKESIKKFEKRISKKGILSGLNPKDVLAQLGLGFRIILTS